MEKVASKIDKHITEMDLGRQLISSRGDVSEEVKAKLISVTDLNLCQNLLASWPEVVNILQLFPTIQRVDLTGNRIEMPSDFCVSDVLGFKKALGSIKAINLGGNDLTWHQLMHCEFQIFPCGLEALTLYRNAIDEIQLPPLSAFNSLKSLDLSSNKLQDWEQVNKLGRLPM